MTLAAATITDAMGGWVQGCLVLLVGVWLFLALLGIRNSRFPGRIVCGLGFVVGSALWIGLHPTLAENWHLDAGWLGWRAHLRIAEPLAGNAFALNALGALLLLASVGGLLIALDWLPLLPLAALLDRLDARRAVARTSGGVATPTGSSGPIEKGAARLRVAAPARVEQEVAPPPKVFEAAAIEAPETPPVADATDPSPEAIATNWSRFRPRANVEIAPETPGDLPVDKGTGATHNTTPLEGERDAPEGEPVHEDATVVDQELDEVTATASDPAQEAEVAEEVEPAEAGDETLAPRRKKEEEPEEPEKAPDDPDEEKEPDEDDDEEDWDDDPDKKEEEDDEDDDWDEDEDEDWDEEDEEEEEEEEEEDKDEEEEEEKEEEEEEDEDWEEDDDEEEDEEEEREGGGEETFAPPSPSATDVAPAAPPADSEAALPAGLFSDLPPDERRALVRAVDLIAGSESVSLSRIQRELGITYYSAARVFDRLEKEGFIAGYSGSLARTVQVTREQWEERRRAP